MLPEAVRIHTRRMETTYAPRAFVDLARLGTTIDLAVEPTINEFNGRSNVELEVRDISLLMGRLR